MRLKILISCLVLVVSSFQLKTNQYTEPNWIVWSKTVKLKRSDFIRKKLDKDWRHKFMISYSTESWIKGSLVVPVEAVFVKDKCFVSEKMKGEKLENHIVYMQTLFDIMELISRKAKYNLAKLEADTRENQVVKSNKVVDSVFNVEYGNIAERYKRDVLQTQDSKKHMEYKRYVDSMLIVYHDYRFQVVEVPIKNMWE